MRGRRRGASGKTSALLLGKEERSAPSKSSFQKQESGAGGARLEARAAQALEPA